jgi:hypothetical protein
VLHGGQVDRRGQRREVAGVVGVRHGRVPSCGSSRGRRRPPARIAGGTKAAGGGSAVPPSLAVPATADRGPLHLGSCGRFY